MNSIDKKEIEKLQEKSEEVKTYLNNNTFTDFLDNIN